MLKMLRPYLSQYVKNTKIFWEIEKRYLFRNPKVLGRHACLGAEVLGRLNEVKSINFQKNRVDHINSFVDKNRLPLRLAEINNIFEKWPVRSYVQRQSKDLIKMPDFEFFIIDSFSELADQRFIFNNKIFYCCYSDIKKEIRNNYGLISQGLLPIELIEAEYRTLFKRIHSQSLNCKIIYLHFPMIKETREHFLIRAREIKRIISNLRNEFSNLYAYSLDDDLAIELNVNDNDSFPYHYHTAVYDEFVKLIVHDFPEFKKVI